MLARVNDEWVFGRLKSGQEGMFPATFVDHLPEGLPMKSELDKKEESIKKAGISVREEEGGREGWDECWCLFFTDKVWEG